MLAQVAAEVIEAADGYATHELLRHGETQAVVADGQHAALADLLAASGLGTGTLPEPLHQSLLKSTRARPAVVRVATAAS